MSIERTGPLEVSDRLLAQLGALDLVAVGPRVRGTSFKKRIPTGIL